VLPWGSSVVPAPDWEQSLRPPVPPTPVRTGEQPELDPEAASRRQPLSSREFRFGNVNEPEPEMNLHLNAAPEGPQGAREPELESHPQSQTEETPTAMEPEPEAGWQLPLRTPSSAPFWHPSGTDAPASDILDAAPSVSDSSVPDAISGAPDARCQCSTRCTKCDRK
jgi:hypothetical protein